MPQGGDDIVGGEFGDGEVEAAVAVEVAGGDARGHGAGFVAELRLERTAEAEPHLLQELRAFPRNVRARGALAVLYNESGRSEEAGELLAAMVRVSPTPEGYSLAARLWTSFGNPSRAAAVRAEAARASAGRRTPATAAQ